MKKTIFKTLTMAVLAFSFSCTSSNEGGSTVAENPMDVETANEAEVIGDEADLPVDNEPIDYDDMFNNVEETENHSILDLAKMDDNLSIFVRLVELSGMDASLAAIQENEVPGVSEVTVFIPTDEAFKNMPEERYEYLINPDNKAELIKVIKMHILPNEVPLIQFNSSQVITTQGENNIPVSTEMAGNVVYVGGAQIVKPDIEASNGIIHVVNAVIEPSEFADDID